MIETWRPTAPVFDRRVTIMELWRDQVALQKLVPDCAFARPISIDEARSRGVFSRRVIIERNWIMALRQPFPSSPSRPPKFSIHLTDEDGRLCVFCFCELYPAKRMIELVADGDADEMRWSGSNEVYLPNGVRIAGDSFAVLEKIVEHEYTRDEAAWVTPEPYATMWRTFGRKGAVVDDDGNELKPIAIATTGRRSRRERKPRERVERVKREASPRRERVDGQTTIADIAQEVGMLPRDARAILRKANEPKPASGLWAWGEADAERIRKLLTSSS